MATISETVGLLPGTLPGDALADGAVLRDELLGALLDVGYFHYYLTFGDGNFRIKDWEGAYALQPPDLRMAIDFFLLGNEVPAEGLSALVGERSLEILERYGLAARCDDGIRLAPFRLVIFHKVVIFFELSSDPQLYFGDDSVGLGTYLLPGTTRDSALDLCTGTAIQAMIASRHVDRAVAVEINPVAARVARLNIALNGLASRVHLENADLKDYLRDCRESFDIISFNPPLLPIPFDLEYPFVGDGGEDGLDVTRRIIKASHRLLTGKGTIQFVGTGFMSGGRPAFAEDLMALAEECSLGSGFVHVTSRHPLDPRSPLFQGLVDSTMVRSTGHSRDEVSSMLLSHYESREADELAFFYARLGRPRSRGGIRVIGTHEAFFGDWFV